ncbi:MAG TPA: gliding motility-associated C-terminal domain-containing protein [Chryseolinea sp.]|nr:gliding motility-associated C-terminal domain-containing protein [Chryseolinea sp.]
MSDTAIYRLWPVVLTLLAATSMHAQVIHNGSNIYVGSGVELHVDGSVANSGFVQNQGELLVAGDWINTNVYQGLGRLTLNGNTTQRLRNNGNSLYSLRISSLGRVDLQDNLTIDNRIELSQGVIHVSTPYSLTTANSATVAGGSSASFVEGPLISRGTGYKFMPIGKNGRYYPVEMLDVTGVEPVVQVEAFEDMSAFRLAGYGRTLSAVYWQQSVLSGTYTGSPMTIGYDLPVTADAGLDIFQSAEASELFTPVGNTTAAYESALDKITTANAVTGTLFLIGNRINVAPGEASFYFPTSLSPDAANPDNRSLRVYGEQLISEGFLFVVYNRWGQRVYESRSLEEMSTQGWSGQQQAGGILTSGAYPYLLKAKRKTGEAMEQKGLISIVR